MKRLLIVLLAFTQIVNGLPDPMLVVLLMVKNEEHVMEKTLEPFLKANVKAIVVLDTGSRDGTIAETYRIFEKYHVDHGYVFEQPFINFSASRNYLIECAEEKFPTAGFFFMIDAEWYMHNVEGLLNYCKIHHSLPDPTYLLRLTDGFRYFSTQRLFRPHRGVHFEGAVHEAVNQPTNRRVPDDIFAEYNPSKQGIESSRKRWERDRDLLLQDDAENPNSPRTLFYLAQTYGCLNDLENACVWYKKRCAIDGWDEENFMAYYRLAQTYDAMDKWPQALCCYLQAYNMRPTRAEPLVSIALHYLGEQKFMLAFMFARQAILLEYPENDVLFLEKIVYDYVRYDTLGIAAWYVGEWKIGQEAVLQAMKYAPQAQHLHNNLVLYLQHT